ncbi:MAG: 50S ribosomal protein L17 [Sedimentibacter sp.]
MGSHRKLGITTDHRVAMLRNMTADLINNGRLVTTITRAKELRRVAEKTITLGKRGDLHARRQAIAYLYDKDAVYKLFAEVAPKYSDRNGGYTRILKLGPRRGDGAEMAIIELV